MEVKKIHSVEIYINNKRADIFSQDELNLRFNNTFANPSKISTIQTEYSFSFTLPITSNNQKIFDFANIPSKRNKFNKHFKTHINADGILIFDGDLILQSVSKEGYKCNLYINRLNTVEKIFGETTMNEIIGWEIDYNQNVTINEYNRGDIDYSTKDIFFPLISYGLFQKFPTMGDTYTPKHQVDSTTRLYNENFYPSFNLLKLVEKCFETKGYTVDGDIFDDNVLRKIYTSTPLGNEQNPIYNYGNDNMGKFDMDFTYTNYQASGYTINGVELRADQFATAIPVQLDTPKYPSSQNGDEVIYYNWEYNNVYDIWSAGSNFLTNKTFNISNNILWRDNRIVAPADGWYKIGLSLDYSINQSRKFTRGYYANGQEVKITNTDDVWDFYQFPIEFQILKNDEDGMGAKMIIPDTITGYTYFNYEDGKLSTTENTTINKNGMPPYPHEATWMDIIGEFDVNNPNPYLGGYCPKNGYTLCYDSSVNPDFICGCADAGSIYYTSYIKNGKSWKKDCDDVAQARYNSDAYNGIKFTTSGVNDIDSPSSNNYNKNTLNGAGNTLSHSMSSAGCSASCEIEMIIFLKKNDYLQLKMLQRQWTNMDSASEWNYGGTEQTDAIVNVTGNIHFECYAPSDKLTVNSDMSYTGDSLFPTQLNISNFLPNDEKMSDFINNFIKEFNLSYQQVGKNITLNKQYIDFKTKNAVDLSDRVSSDELEMEAIDFPSQMSVEYTINDEERGFYISAERNATDEQMLSSDWKEYADRGFDVIDIMPDEWADASKVTTKASYNWFEDFNFVEGGTISTTANTTTLSLPVIGKDEWYIEGYKYAEMMKNDGHNLKRRYWFPSDGLTDVTIPLNGDSTKMVTIKTVNDTYDGINLSYKILENGESLLTKYFNIFYDADTNYIKFDCYLTTEEYLAIKNGSNIIIDDDVYIPIELKGYDVSGGNPTEIVAIKK